MNSVNTFPIKNFILNLAPGIRYPCRAAPGYETQ